MASYVNRVLVWTAALVFSAAATANVDTFFEFDEPSAPSTDVSHAAGEILLFQGPDLDGVVHRVGPTGVWRIEQGQEATLLAALPAESSSRFSAAIHGASLYLANARPAPLLSRLDLDNPGRGWQTVSSSPADVASRPVIAVLHGQLYVASASGGHIYDLNNDTWEAMTAAPSFVVESIAAGVGDAHIMYVKSGQSSEQAWLYHVVTDAWVQGPSLPVPVQAAGIVSNAAEFAIVSNDTVLRGKAVLRVNHFETLDYLAVILLIAPLVVIGFLSSRKKKQSSGDYFRAGKTMPWWAASLSIFATGASAITIMSMPAMAFSGDWIYVSIALFLISIQVPLFVFVYVPILRRLNISTANEYLERRYGLSVRMLGFVSFSLYQILGRTAAILLLPAIAISSVFGLPMEVCILAIGILTTLFVTSGGLKVVIWTDVLMAGLIVVAVLVSATFAIMSIEMSASDALALITEERKLRMFDFRMDWRAPVVIVLFLNSFATSLGYIADQNFVQRVQCTPEERDAKKASVAQLFIAVPLNFILFSLGTLLFLYYVTRPEALSPAMKMDGVYPYFSATALPEGMAGLVVVALLAATISTVSSALNSVSNLGVEDIYRRFRPDVTEKQCVRLGRILTIGLGAFGTSVALVLASSSSLQSVWDLFLMVMGLIIGPVTGIFVLGVFSRRANTVGVWTGAVASVAANYYAKTYMDLHATVYLSIGLFSCLIVGYLASLMSKPKGEQIEGLTIYTLDKK